MSDFKLRLIHAARVDGRLVGAGHVVEVDARIAVDLIRREAAVLMVDADLARLAAAVGLHNGARWVTPSTR